jgi:type IX secretion system PorP/SprF family membrane protein
MLLGCYTRSRAQHYQFSQFYAAQTYLNPAFAGANVCSRMSLNYRNQWAGIPGGFTTYQLAYDHYLRNAKSGIGFMVFNDKAGLGALKTTQFSMQYAYEVKLNKELMGRGGISFGGVQRSINFNTLTFGDQIARGGASSSAENLPGDRIMYFDLGTGVLLYSKNYWGGFSAAHINNPNQSLLDVLSPLPPELKLHGGYRYTIYESSGNNKEVEAVTFAFNYKKQRAFNQLDVGAYYSKDFIVFGVWYRGIPFYKPRSGYRNNDAVIMLLGLSVDKFKIGYSYDVTISKLTNVNSLGSHEISMSYQFCNPKKKKQKRILISCPKF